MEHTFLNGSLDPANAKDPTLLARQLLELIPESPSLAIIVRLMYCIKPSDADWEHPDFPYLYVDLGQDIADFSLEKAVKFTAEQISDELTSDQLSHFADKIPNIIGPPVRFFFLLKSLDHLNVSLRSQDSDQSYRLACLLSNIAPQNSELTKLILARRPT